MATCKLDTLTLLILESCARIFFQQNMYLFDFINRARALLIRVLPLMRTVHGPLSISIDGARLLLILWDILSPILMNCSCKKVDFPIKIICGWCITSGCLLKKSLLMFEKNVCFSYWHLAQGCQCIRKHQYFWGSVCRFRGSGVEVSSTNRTSKAAPSLP